MIDITDIEISENGMSIDFGLIKGYFKEHWDHKMFVPSDYFDAIQNALLEVYYGVGMAHPNTYLVPIEKTSAEWMAVEILKALCDKFDRDTDQVHFEIWEGPHQFAVV